MQAAPAHLLAVLYIVMPPFLRFQSRSEILLSLGQLAVLGVHFEQATQPVLESSLTGAEGCLCQNCFL